jgi:ribosome recycling factor
MSSIQRVALRAIRRTTLVAAPATSQLLRTSFDVTPVCSGPTYAHVRHFAKKSDKKNDKKDKKSKDADEEESSDSPDSPAGAIDTAPFIEKMENHVSYFTNELSGLRVGRPSPDMLNDIPIETAGMRVALKNLGQIYVKPPQSLLVSLYEPSDSLEAAVCKSLNTAGLDLNPQVEVVNGVNAIVVPFPKATREVRDSLIKQTKAKAEESKTHIRGVRKTWMDAIKKAKPPKDDAKKMEKDCQNATDKHVDEISALATTKEKELNAA